MCRACTGKVDTGEKRLLHALRGVGYVVAGATLSCHQRFS